MLRGIINDALLLHLLLVRIKEVYEYSGGFKCSHGIKYYRRDFVLTLLAHTGWEVFEVLWQAGSVPSSKCLSALDVSNFGTGLEQDVFLCHPEYPLPRPTIIPT